MTTFEQNLNVLKKRFPKIATALSSNPEKMHVIGSEVIEGRRVLFAQTGEKVYQLDSLYDSESLLDLWLSNMPDLPVFGKVFLFGIGNGMMAKRLLQTVDSSVKVIVYEPNLDVLSYILELEDFTDLFGDERFDLIVRTEIPSLPVDEFISRLTFTDVGKFQYYVYPNYNYLYLEEYLEYMSELEKAVSSINSSQSVIGRYNAAYFENTFENIPYLCSSKSLEALYMTMPKDIPAIVVASGPSLDLNVANLAAAKGKAFIIAADSSLRTLLKAGIVPDMCVSIDPKKLSKHFSNDLANDIPMVCMLSSNREILKNHRAEKFFVNDLNHHVQHFFSGKKIVFPATSSGGSVANDAFSICRLLGLDTIIMVGQDLAYTGDKTHSEASVRGEWKMDISKFSNNVVTLDIYGNPIVSSGEFTLYRSWLEEQIAANPELDVIDATEGGALINGTRIMTLAEAIDEKCTREVDVDSLIKNCARFMDDELVAEFIDYLKEIPAELDLCKRKCNDGIKTYDDMLKLIYKDKYTNQSFKNQVQKTGQISAYLDKRPVMEYVKNLIQNETTEFLKNVYDNQENERANLIASCNMGRDYLEIMKSGIERILPKIQEKLAAL